MIMFTGDIEAAGMIPLWLSESDPRSATEQLHKHYDHGGGWHAFGKAEWKMDPDGTLCYPDDPPFKPLATGRLRDEIIRVYDFGIVSVAAQNGTFEVARMD